jgi:SAM-dependent methyltransferase
MSEFDYDAELRLYQDRLRAAIDVGPRDSVLDIGCGGGQTTCEAAGLAVEGSALGVDMSLEMVTRARSRAEGENLRNVRFEQADVQVHPFPPAAFSLGISRFGTMFFADPVKAFTNIARALRPGARLVQLVWQDGVRQEWVTEIRGALEEGPPPPAAFSFGDPAVVDGVLTAAGFTDVRVTEAHEPVWYGADPDAAVDSVLALRKAGGGLDTDRLRSVMVEHDTADGVWFDSWAWLVEARR